MSYYDLYEERYTRRGLLQYRFPAYSARAERLFLFHHTRVARRITS